jgi:hypothetical protein
VQAPLSASAVSSWLDVGGSAGGKLSPEGAPTLILLQSYKSRIHRGRRAAQKCTEQLPDFKGVIEAQFEVQNISRDRRSNLDDRPLFIHMGCQSRTLKKPNRHTISTRKIISKNRSHTHNYTHVSDCEFPEQYYCTSTPTCLSSTKFRTPRCLQTGPPANANS